MTVRVPGGRGSPGAGVVGGCELPNTRVVVGLRSSVRTVCTHFVAEPSLQPISAPSLNAVVHDFLLFAYFLDFLFCSVLRQSP